MTGMVTGVLAAPEISPRPMARSAMPPGMAGSGGSIVEIRAKRNNLAFDKWITDFRRRALSRGISPAVFDRAFRDVQYNTDVIGKDRNQSEFTKQIWEYLDSTALWRGQGNRDGDLGP